MKNQECALPENWNIYLNPRQRKQRRSFLVKRWDDGRAMSQKILKLRVKKNKNVIGGKESPVALFKACSNCSLLLALGHIDGKET